MSNLVSWVQLERQILRRLNAITGNSPTAANTAVSAAPPLSAAALSDAAFPLFSVRLEAVQIVEELAAYICRRPGDSYRKLYRALITVNAGDAAPASAGGYGGVNYKDTERSATDPDYRIPFDKADSPRDILDVLGCSDVFGSGEVYLYCVDGAVFYATRFPVEVEVFIYERVGVDASGNLSVTKVNELFDAWTDEANLPNEFLSLAADGAAARLAMQASAYLDNARDLWMAYQSQLQSHGFIASPQDFPVNPTGNA